MSVSWDKWIKAHPDRRMPPHLWQAMRTHYEDQLEELRAETQESNGLRMKNAAVTPVTYLRERTKFNAHVVY